MSLLLVIENYSRKNRGRVSAYPELTLKDIDFNKIALVFVMLFKINCIFADYKKNKHGVCVSYRGI
jgi:hypothetical protein